MGCDIHVHGEVKINGQWHHWSHPRIPRNYLLFGKMAGVRDSGPPIAEPRGFPDDATFTTRFNFELHPDDVHTPSWLTGEEIEQLAEWFDEKMTEETGKWISFHHHFLGYVFGNGWDVKNCPEDLPAGVEDARIVFWFDN